MTREELRDYVESLRSQNEISYDIYSGLIDGIDTLEQEPCNDVISRQAVLEFLKGFEILHNHDELRSNLIYEIMNLTPVTPQLKTEQWITLEEWKNDFKSFINELSMPKDDYNGIIEYIDEVPSVTPKQKTGHWIPVSERLPEDGRPVLIYAWNVHHIIARYDSFRTENGYKKCWVTADAWNGNTEIKHDVIAWMPLPKPYKVESEE